MAWTSRTTRDSAPIGNPFKLGGTAPTVGPGSYAAPSSIKAAPPQYVPFSTSSKRSSTHAGGTAVGPGQYNPPPAVAAPPKPFMETPFMSFADRFSSGRGSAPAVPGPGAYDADKEALAARVARRRREAAITRDTASGGGGGGSGGDGGDGAVSWMRVPTAPSIPAGSQSFGYEEGPGGSLIPQVAPDVGHSGKGTDVAGPGTYNPNDRALAGRVTTSVDFSKARSSRTDFTRTTGDAPGPGDYNPRLPTGPANLNRGRGQATFASRTKRSGGTATSSATRDLPGPGAYPTHKLSAFGTKKVAAKQQSFGTRSRRFGAGGPRRGAGPGPGSYTAPSTFKKPSTAPTRTRAFGRVAAAPVPFTTGAARFSASSRSAATSGPAPGTYSVPTMAADLMRKRDRSRVGVFGSTSRRFYEPGATDPAQLPGPGEYERPGGAGGDPSGGSSGYVAPSSVFASKAGRFKVPSNGGGSDGPDPGSYSPRTSWNGNSFARRADGTQGLLCSGGERFARGRAAGVPGPGSYNPKVGGSGVAVGALVTGAPRFEVKLSDPGALPGPGHYNVEPVGGSMNRRTYNMTVAEEEQRADLVAVHARRG